MVDKEILVYRNTKELRKFIASDKRPVYSFSFNKIESQLKNSRNIIIDITSMIYFAKVTPNIRIQCETFFESIGDETTIIVKADCSDDAIDFFPYCFSRKVFIYDHLHERALFKEMQDRIIYTYDTNDNLMLIRDYCKTKGVSLLTFQQVNKILLEGYEQFDSKSEIIIDITSVAYIIENTKNVIFMLEQLLLELLNMKFIVNVNMAKKIFEYFPLYFNKQESVTKLFPELKFKELSYMDSEIIRVVDKTTDLDVTMSYVDKRLFGHSYFKKELRKALKKFRILYEFDELPIYSVFLFGESGIGKTEVARLIAKSLKEDAYLAKINFQNYSSQDSLNSLIGSPAGYVGCEYGELSEKISKSQVGVLLCDEFEKATRPVFSFFLQLLEEGKFTDSLAREYDLSGYIVIFTSNLRSEEEYKRVIPPELQTRFDLVFKFDEPTLEDKEAYLKYLFQNASKKFEKYSFFDNIDYHKIIDLSEYESRSLREIKKEFDNKLFNYMDDNDVN